VPFRLEDQDALLSPWWGSQSSSLRFWIENLDSAQSLPMGFLGLLWVAQVNGRFPLAGPSPWSAVTRSGRRALGWLHTRVTGRDWDGGDQNITFESWDGWGKTIQVLHLSEIWEPKETTKTKVCRVPYQIPFYTDVIRAHLLIGWPAGGILKQFPQMLYQKLWGYFFLSFPSQVLGSTVFPTQVNLFL
jgi:hypothetical protein